MNPKHVCNTSVYWRETFVFVCCRKSLAALPIVTWDHVDLPFRCFSLETVGKHSRCPVLWRLPKASVPSASSDRRCRFLCYSPFWGLLRFASLEGTKEIWRPNLLFVLTWFLKRTFFSPREFIYWGVSLVSGKKEKQKYVLIDCSLSNPVLMNLDYPLESFVLVWNMFLLCGQLSFFFLIPQLESYRFRQMKLYSSSSFFFFFTFYANL